jgi:hypothetical protein
LKRQFQKLVILFKRYERHITSFALLFGFTVDSLTLTRIDLWLDNLILIWYLSLATAGIVVVNLYEGKVLKGKFFGYVSTFAPIPIQYAFGGLFSGFIIFYVRSASIATSWPFLLFLAGLLIGNEFFRSRYEKLNFQISILFIAIFSYSVFSVPVLVGSIGPKVFLLSGAVSLAIINLVLYSMSLFLKEKVKQSRKILTKSIVSIYIIMNGLYFLNIIPPIPLSLKDAGVYNNIYRGAGNEYILERADRTWLRRYVLTDEIKIGAGRKSVFAPTKLNTQIVHRWEFFDDNNNWVTRSKVDYPIIGGRDGGYRGYSLKSNMEQGKWRVSVETTRGQVLGRVRFTVIAN